MIASSIYAMPHIPRIRFLYFKWCSIYHGSLLNKDENEKNHTISGENLLEMLRILDWNSQ